MLLAAIVFVGARTYNLWQEGPWELPKPASGKAPSADGEPKKEVPPPQMVNTKIIVDKNLFDPERGASRAKEAEASSVAVQRVRSMVLLGTAILGNSRYAILEGPADSSAPAAKNPAAQPNRLRVKLGDTLEGFKLSEIHEKKVIFTKGASKVEVALDFFRKVGETNQSPPGPIPPRPGVAPRVPRPPEGEVPSPVVTP